MNLLDMDFPDGRPRVHHVTHFMLAFRRVEEGEGRAKTVSYVSSPQILFRPERVIVRARVMPGWAERFARALGWVRFPWLERRWIVEGEDELEAELDEDDGDAEEDLQDLVAVGPIEDEEEDDTDTELASEPKRAWRLRWLRPFDAWAHRIYYREQHKQLGKCFVKDIIVDGESLLSGGPPIPVTAFVEVSIPMRIDSPACKANGKIEIPLEGVVPEMDVVMFGLGAQDAGPPPMRVYGPSEPLVR